MLGHEFSNLFRNIKPAQYAFIYTTFQ